MNRLFRVLAAAALTLPLLVSCGGAPSSGLNLQGEGSIEVALTSAPNDASCLRLSIDTSRNSPYLFDLTSDTSTISYRIPPSSPRTSTTASPTPFAASRT